MYFNEGKGFACFLIGQIRRPKHGITRTKGTNIRFKSKYEL